MHNTLITSDPSYNKSSLVVSHADVYCLARMFIMYVHTACYITRSRDFFFNLCGGTLGTAATTGLLYQPRLIGEGDCG
jgi:hypothetical protein